MLFLGLNTLILMKLVADAALYSSLSEPDTLPPDCPFTFLYLSSQDSIKDDNLEDLEQLRWF